MSPTADIRCIDSVEVRVWFAGSRWIALATTVNVLAIGHSREVAIEELRRWLDIEEKDIATFGASGPADPAPAGADQMTLNRGPKGRWKL